MSYFHYYAFLFYFLKDQQHYMPFIQRPFDEAWQLWWESNQNPNT